MAACELCLITTAPSKLHSVSPSEMTNRFHPGMRVENRVAVCESCLADLRVVALSLARWQGRIKITSELNERRSSTDVNVHNAGESAATSPFFECLLCNATPFTDQSLLASHELMNHRCFHCSALFPDKHQLQSHSALCLKDMKFECPVCRLRFESESRLSGHLSACHEDLIKTEECPICGAVFASSSALCSHSRVHQRERRLAAADSEGSVRKKARSDGCASFDDEKQKLSAQGLKTYSRIYTSANGSRETQSIAP